MQEIMNFSFNNNEVRTTMVDGVPYFVGKDVASVLGYTNTRKALNDHVDEEDKGVTKCDTLGGKQDMTIINESGMYSLVLSSKLPQAKAFKRWVTSEVLPQIRKTGAYALPQSYTEALAQLLKHAQENEKLQLENKAKSQVIEEQKPKVDFYNQVTGSKDTIEMANVAKALNIKGYGRNNLFEFLRQKGVLRNDNTPYQRYCDMGYFRVIERKYTHNGEVKISLKTVVYQKGVAFIKRLIEKEN